MIFGLHNLVDAMSHYTRDHVSNDGSGWILLLDSILLIPLMFAVFFYPLAVLTGAAIALLFVLLFFGLFRVVHAHRQHVGHS